MKIKTSQIELNSKIRELERLKQVRIERGKYIDNLLAFLSGFGRTRRIRPCDMSDPHETECPAGNALDDA